METLITLILLVIAAALAKFLGIFVLNIFGVPGALIAGKRRKSLDARYISGCVIATIGQGYVYLSDSAISENIRRLAQPGALTSVLNWYRALNPQVRIGKISVPALYIWGSQDLALGETAAIDTARYMCGPYYFKKLEGRSHWLLRKFPTRWWS